MRSFEMRSNSITKTLINNLPFTFRDRRLAVLPFCIFLSFLLYCQKNQLFFMYNPHKERLNIHAEKSVS